MDDVVTDLREDRQVLAAALCGSLAYDVVWERSDIDLVVVVAERPGNEPGQGMLRYAGVNVHAILVTRDEFMRLRVGALRGSLWDSIQETSRLLFSRDQTIEALFDDVRTLGTRDRAVVMMEQACNVGADPHESAEVAAGQGRPDLRVVVGALRAPGSGPHRGAPARHHANPRSDPAGGRARPRAVRRGLFRPARKEEDEGPRGRSGRAARRLPAGTTSGPVRPLARLPRRASRTRARRRDRAPLLAPFGRARGGVRLFSEVLDLSIEEAASFFEDRPAVSRPVSVLNELGLGYLTLGQSATTLSGGEAQRVKLATELSRVRRGGHVLYILDEPTTGLHLADIERLLEALQRLVDAGNSVLVIEHHPDVIKCADHVIDLGPEGGNDGGMVVVTGTPEEVAACEASHTGRFLAARLA